MWSAPLILVLELPPLAFGPALPPKAFAPPRELTCAIRDLGRIQPPLVPSLRLSQGLTLNARGLSSTPRQPGVNSAADLPWFLAVMIATEGHWDERTWAEKTWSGVAPVLIPPQQVP